jgi:hypothetical protein
MAEPNHTLPSRENLARALNALNVANDLSECLYFIADALQEDPKSRAAAVTATRHLSRLLCWHLDVAQRALIPGPGFGSFESDLASLSH